MNPHADAARAAKVSALVETFAALPMFAGDLDLAADVADTVADETWTAVAILARVRPPSSTTIAAVRIRLRAMARAAASAPADPWAAFA